MVEKENIDSILCAHVVVKIMKPLSEKETGYLRLEVAAIVEAKLIPCLLLKTARLLCMTNDEGLEFVRAISVTHPSNRHTSLALLRSFHLSLSGSLFGRKALEPRFVHVVDVSKREFF